MEKKNMTPIDESASPQELLDAINSKSETLSPAEAAQLIRRLVTLRQENRAKEKEAARTRTRESKKEETARAREEKKAAAAKERAAHAAHVAEVTAMELPLDWENAFCDDPRAEGTYTESIPDGLVRSLTTLGRVDIEYIAKITDTSCKEVILGLRGAIFQNPETWGECFYRGWETAEEYLSGNLIRKWQVAKAANKSYSGYFRENIKALEAALPPAVPTDKIYVTLGSPWVPTEVIDEFINHILQIRYRPYHGTRHDEETGTWEIPDKEALYSRNTVAAGTTYGTRRIHALSLLEKTLNMRTVTVTDEEILPGPKRKVRHVLNQEETVLALEKQTMLIEEFRRWVFADEERREALSVLYGNKYGCVRRRIFDGSFLTFPTMSDAISLYPYQKNAVARILFSPNTLLAHDVGSGKTYIMIAAGMELRRMGLSQKNLYVLPNNLVSQWESIFRTMYPHARILSVTPSRFTPSRRLAMLERIRDEDHDAILMAYSCFERISVSCRYHEEELNELWEKLEKIAADPQKATSYVNRKKSAVKKELAKAAAAIEAPEDIPFDQLGITRLFVDEAHNYKNVPIETKSDKVNGISSGGSQKCRDMLDKVRIVQKKNGGGGVVMATGTPITNSITDAFVMQQYLQSGELTLLDLQTFDSWIGMFAERVTEFEIDVDTSGYRLVTRFSRFHNLPELTAIFSSVADFHQVGPGAGLPAFDGYHDALLPRSAELRDFLKDISSRADNVRRGRIPMREDNMLKITTDGRKAALDLRLVERETFSHPGTKVAECAENVMTIYRATAATRATQLVFCDISTPKSSFNMYDELRRLLIEGGIPGEEIAFIHDATGERRRTLLFSKVCAGEVRVLIGSTFKLGMGVNVQERLIAIHHLDVPWRPADMTQREGRILRQGNTNERVFIYRYITEGSFDAYSWQILETKQRFITGLLSGAITERSGSDVDGRALNYAEVKALAIGNPLIKERVEVANELARCFTLQSRAVEEHIRMERELSELPARISHQNDLIKRCRGDCEFLKEEQKSALPPLPKSPSLPSAGEGGGSPFTEEAVAALSAEEEAWRRGREERRLLRERLSLALRENVLSTTETYFGEYRGFGIYLPANMDTVHPFVRLARDGHYAVDVGITEGGCLIRIDSFLDALPEHLAKLRENLRRMKARRDGLTVELKKTTGYAERIEALTVRLAEIDQKLGVTAS